MTRFEKRPIEVKDENKRILRSEHPDVGWLPPLGRFIHINGVRELERESNFRPFEGRRRVFIVEGAECLNPQAANALLKTLEEAPATTHIVLITSRLSSLLPTILSRCQVVRFAPMPVAELEKFLIESHEKAGDEARLAAHISGGKPGEALSTNLDLFRERREAMLTVVEALGTPQGRVRLLRAAEELSETRNKDEFEPRLDVLETLIHDIWQLKLSGADAKIVNVDLRERLCRLSQSIEVSDPPRWLGEIEDVRLQLEVNINRRIATDALFLTMART
jgi:DNA polymerase-3 subunit delta'